MQTHAVWSLTTGRSAMESAPLIIIFVLFTVFVLFRFAIDWLIYYLFFPETSEKVVVREFTDAAETMSRCVT